MGAENYTLGKGVINFNRKNMTTGIYEGERDLGNAPAFAFSIAIEKLEHFSSRGGLKAKDKLIVSQMTPSCSFTLDEINDENFALLSMADIVAVNQAAGSAVDEVVVVKLGKMSQLAKRKVGLITLAHGTVTSGPFTTAMTVTGGTSTSTGKVCAVGSGHIQVALLTGPGFSSAETITSGSTSATTNAASVWVPGVLSVKNTAGTTTYIAGTDYEVLTALKDDQVGRIRWKATGGTVTEDQSVKVTYGYAVSAYKEIRAFKQTQVEGKLRFVSDNPAGAQYEVEIWRVSLTPAGDVAMIGDSWSTLGFTGEVLKDEAGHPDSPYMNIIMS